MKQIISLFLCIVQVFIIFDLLQDGVLLWDDSSKYGTYVNEGIDKGTKLDKDAKVTIKDGCRVRFGLQENIWV